MDRLVELTIPAGTTNGKSYACKRPGNADSTRPQQRGNLIATVQVQLPTNLSPKNASVRTAAQAPEQVKLGSSRFLSCSI